MIVFGVTITDAQVQACEQVMTRPSFDINEVIRAAREAGVPEHAKVRDRILGYMRTEALADRVADRLIQRARKSGRIVRQGRSWKAAHLETT